MELSEAGFVIGEVAKAEGCGHKLERVVANRQMQRIGFHGDGAMLLELRRAAQEHLMREVDGEQRHGLWRATPQQRHRHIARTAADVRDTRLWLRQNVAEAPCGAPPPQPVNGSGEDMIQ